MAREEERGERRVLYVISCGSPLAGSVPALVASAHEAHWKVCVITTPQGTHFLDLSLLEKMTGFPVRSQYKLPDAPDLLPPADALIAFPLTFNTLNKWALGITDTLAVGLLCEYTGLKVPIVAVPVTGEGLGDHPAFSRSVRMLRRYGIHVLSSTDVSLLEQEPSATMILEELKRYVH